MNDKILADAHAVFLPSFTGLQLGSLGTRFLESGGKAILVGQSSEEYAAREMSADRVAVESREDFKRFVQAARALAGTVVIAVDQELGGLRRLHKLVPPMPSPAEALAMPSEELVAKIRLMASSARAIGVNMFLSPVLDYAIGVNPWLTGRLVSNDPGEVGRIGALFVEAAKAEGIATTAKHFPGYSRLDGDPSVEDVKFAGTPQQLENGFVAFERAVAAGVTAVMNGPAIVEAIDPDEAPSCSAKAVALLRDRFKFTGLIVSDDLDSRATVRDGKVEDVAVKALRAGSDLMIVPADAHLFDLARAVAKAVQSGLLSRERLADAAGNVRRLADSLAATHAATSPLARVRAMD